MLYQINDRLSDRKGTKKIANVQEKSHFGVIF